MLGRLPEPAFMPCPDCGASVARGDEEHECDRERWLDYQLFLLRAGVERLEDDFGAFFESPEGRFHLGDAERRREEADEEKPEE
jgi:hypothetical protein